MTERGDAEFPEVCRPLAWATVRHRRHSHGMSPRIVPDPSFAASWRYPPAFPPAR